MLVNLTQPQTMEDFSKKVEETAPSTKVIVTFTVFIPESMSEHEENVHIGYLAQEYVYSLGEHIGYEGLCHTAGKHVVSSRPHWHIMVIYDTKGKKIYKDLASKFQREKKNVMIPNPVQDLEIKISFIYQGIPVYKGNSMKEYDENALKYPFKEYDEFSLIPLEHQYGFTEEQLEAKRQSAHELWLSTQRKKRQEQLKKEAEDNSQKKFEDYLAENWKEMDYADYMEKINKARLLIWQYKKVQYTLGHCKSVRVGSIRDQAISWLYFTGRLSDSEILQIH